MSREGEVSAGVEEQDITAETVHDASAATRPNVERCQVTHVSSSGLSFYIFACCSLVVEPQLHYKITYSGIIMLSPVC